MKHLSESVDEWGLPLDEAEWGIVSESRISVSKPYFHGSASKFRKFEEPSSGKNYGVGIYLTQDPDEAIQYALGSDGDGWLYTVQPKVSKVFDVHSKMDADKIRREMERRGFKFVTSKQYDFDKPEIWGYEPVDRQNWFWRLISMLGLGHLASEELEKEIYSHFDAIQDLKTKWLVVRDPKNLKITKAQKVSFDDYDWVGAPGEKKYVRKATSNPDRSLEEAEEASGQKVLYHWTSSKAAEEIYRTRTLKPGKPNDRDVAGVYLTDLDNAEDVRRILGSDISTEVCIPVPLESVDLSRAAKPQLYQGEIMSGERYAMNSLKSVHELVYLDEIRLDDPLEEGARGDWEKEGYAFHVDSMSWGSTSSPESGEKFDPKIHDFMIIAKDKDGNDAGHASYHHNPTSSGSGFHSSGIHVYDNKENKKLYPEKNYPDHTRKGLATAMHIEAEKVSGKKLTRAKSYSRAGAKLWSQPNRPFGESVDEWGLPLEEAYTPEKYLKGVKNRKERLKEIEKNAAAHEKGQSRFDDSAWKTDFNKSGERKETKPSKYTSKFKDKFGEGLDESLEKSIKNKAEKCGVPLGIARQVVKRGQAAWASGHRPGTTPEQWGLARLNSFCTGGKTTKTADKDLYKKWKKKD